MTYNSKQLDQLEAVVVVLVVQLRLPVVALVQRLVACGVARVSGILIAHGQVVSSASDDGVDVAAQLAWADNGVGPLHRQRLAVHDEEAALGGSQANGGRKHKKRFGKHFDEDGTRGSSLCLSRRKNLMGSPVT